MKSLIVAVLAPLFLGFGLAGSASAGGEPDMAQVKAACVKAKKLGYNAVLLFINDAGQLIKHGGSKECGVSMLRVEGGRYVIADGDMVFNVGKSALTFDGVAIAPGRFVAKHQGQLQHDKAVALKAK
jgi:hypothetical protein